MGDTTLNILSYHKPKIIQIGNTKEYYYLWKYINNNKMVYFENF